MLTINSLAMRWTVLKWGITRLLRYRDCPLGVKARLIVQLGWALLVSTLAGIYEDWRRPDYYGKSYVEGLLPIVLLGSSALRSWPVLLGYRMPSDPRWRYGVGVVSTPREGAVTDEGLITVRFAAKWKE